LLLAACAPGTDIESAEPLSTILPPTFEVVPGRTSIERFDPPGTGGALDLTIGAQVENPNDFPVRLSRIDYTVFLENRQVARGSFESVIFLDAGGMAPVTFEIATEVGNNVALLRSVVRAFADTPLDFRVEGTLDFSSLSYGFTTRRRELLVGETLARQTVTPPALRLDETASEVFELRAGVPVVRAVVTATNPGDIGYFLYGKDLALRLGGYELALADMDPVPVAAGAGTRIDLLFYPDPALLTAEGRAALDAALDGIATQMEVEGDLQMDVLGVDTFAVPAGWQVVGFVDLDRN
jgi:hypothetical protein